jgi:hypothetical protein
MVTYERNTLKQFLCCMLWEGTISGFQSLNAKLPCKSLSLLLSSHQTEHYMPSDTSIRPSTQQRRRPSFLFIEERILRFQASRGKSKRTGSYLHSAASFPQLSKVLSSLSRALSSQRTDFSTTRILRTSTLAQSIYNQSTIR